MVPTNIGKTSGCAPDYSPGVESKALQISAQQVRLLYTHALAGFAATLLNVGIMIFVLWNDVTYPLLLTWAALLVAISLSRLVLVWMYRRAAPTVAHIRQWRTLFVIGAGSAGTVWGAAGLLFSPYDLLSHQVFLTFVLGGMAVGAVATLSVVTAAFLAFFIPTLLPITVRLFLQGNEISTAMGLLALSFSGVLLVTARNLHAAVAESLSLHLENLNLIQSLSVAKDQTESANRRLAEYSQTLQRSEEYFRSLIENFFDIVAILNSDGIIRYVNPSIERILGYQPKDLIGKNLLKLLEPQKSQHFIDSFAANANRLDATLSGEVHTRHKDGSWHILEVVGRIFLDDPIIAGVVLNARDITERKHLASQLAFAQKMESIGQLAAGIAHEINTPMQYVGDNTRFLQEAFRDLHTLVKKCARLSEASKAGSVTPTHIAEVEATAAEADIEYLSEEIPQAIQQSLEGIERVSQIVQAMKEFSHPGSEDQTEVDLNRAIETTLTVARNEWKYVAEVETDLDPALPLIPAFAGELNHVLLNLIVNAAHATAEVVGNGGNSKGTITVSTRRDDDCAELRIRDTGTGIPEAIRTRIFDPFFTTKEVGKGTGQGLAIAHSVIVHKHGGTIVCETEVGRGTTFIVRLPLASLRRERILVKQRLLFIDDEADVLGAADRLSLWREECGALSQAGGSQ